jgi:hypothetical protein
VIFELEPENSPESNQEVVVYKVFENSGFHVCRKFSENIQISFCFKREIAVACPFVFEEF